VSTPLLNRLRSRRIGRERDMAAGEFFQFLFSVEGMTKTLTRLGFEDVVATPYGTWATFVDEWPALGRLPVGRSAGVLDKTPLLSQLGSTCIWEARKPGAREDRA
jgi:hypothetical protein